MRCPECNTEITDPKSRFCPNCGLPIDNQPQALQEESPSQEKREEEQSKGRKGEPQLSRGMMIFIVVGILFLIIFGSYQYLAHKDDPEYFRTAIDPDSNLADKNAVKFDTLVPDTNKRDSIQRAEKREAEKILNSIRKKPAEESSNEGSSSTDNSQGGESQEGGSTSASENSSTTTESAPISAPKPKIEQLENE